MLRSPNFTVTAMVGYHRANTATSVFYNVPGGLFGHCFRKPALVINGMNYATATSCSISFIPGCQHNAGGVNKPTSSSMWTLETRDQ